MQKLGWILSVIILFCACVETQVEDSTIPTPEIVPPPQPVKRVYFYRIESFSQIQGFNVLVNGAEMLVNEGGKPSEFRTDINDWMVSENNEISITVFWPEGVRFTSGVSPVSFKLFSNDTLIKEYRWPAPGVQDMSSSYPRTINETFKADGFPKVLLERAARVISSTGVLPRDDQQAIAALVEQLRKAFTEKNIPNIDDLFSVKYNDLATARFTTPAAIKAEADKQYLELMEKEAYAIRPFSGRYGYFSTADDRVVRVIQGRIGFPEPALVITWREGRNTRRWDLELYFAKIDGKWVIIR
ncbi:MAG: hypothetical protein LBB72_06765 [Spirochaetaceae bacterium]|jgi:hypothetical protein|nr:hypothetical protein [Spirochaetaceae bacterium]